MRIATDLGGDLARHPGRPVQDRIAHPRGKLIDAMVGGDDVHKSALPLIHGQALRFDAESKSRQRQPAQRRFITWRRKGRASRHGRCGQIAANTFDVPGPVRLTADSADLLGLLDRRVRKPQATGDVAGRGNALGQVHLLSRLRPGNRFAPGNGSKLSRVNRLRDDPHTVATSIIAYR
jgi:hypothetical protein